MNPRALKPHLHVAAATLALALAGTPAPAQWAGPGEWGPPSHRTFVEPGTWMLTFPDEGQSRKVATTAEGGNFAGRLQISCTDSYPQGSLMLWDYHGSALKSVPSDHPDEISQQVIFDFGSQAYRITLYFTPWEGFWSAQGLLSTELLDAFASGQSLQIRALNGDEVNVWGLKGSRKARESMRQVCGI